MRVSVPLYPTNMPGRKVVLDRTHEEPLLIHVVSRNVANTAYTAVKPSHTRCTGSKAAVSGRFQARCVFPSAEYAVAESVAVKAVKGASCAPISAQPLAPVKRPSSFASLLHGFATLLAPGECRLCDQPLLRVATYPVCDACLDMLQATPLEAGCPRCSEPFSVELTREARAQRSVCATCLADEPAFARAVAFGSYDDLRPAVHLMKFEGVPTLAAPLGRLLAAAMLQLREDSPEAMAVVPVPLFRGKRSFNQSTLIAQSALRHVRRADPAWQLSLQPKLLRRTRWTESQFLLSPAQRRDNVRGAFEAGYVRGLHILLVDDIYTTGATVAECTRVLLRAGAASVRVATLARAVKESAIRWRPPLQQTARAGPVSR
jgi:ComF family protein